MFRYMKPIINFPRPIYFPVCISTLSQQSVERSMNSKIQGPSTSDFFLAAAEGIEHPPACDLLDCVPWESLRGGVKWLTAGREVMMSRKGEQPRQDGQRTRPAGALLLEEHVVTRMSRGSMRILELTQAYPHACLAHRLAFRTIPSTIMMGPVTTQ